MYEYQFASLTLHLLLSILLPFHLNLKSGDDTTLFIHCQYHYTLNVQITINPKESQNTL